MAGPLKKINPQHLGGLLSFSALASILAFFYLNTLAPDITWANDGYDGGDLITAAATGGVAHPSGYPTYLLLARLFQLLPLGTLAFRTNLMSAGCVLLAALLAADLVRRTAVGRPAVRIWAAFLAGLGVGLSPLLWSQAVITEVYGLHALFVALILWLDLSTGGCHSKWAPWLAPLSGLVFGLGLGNQVTVGLILPVWLLSAVLTGRAGRVPVQREQNWYTRLNWRSLLGRIGGLLLGLCVYLTLPLRARSGSPVNWGNPVNLEGFWWLVSGQLYQDKVLNLSPGLALSRLGYWAELVGSQLGLVGLLVSLVGLFFAQGNLMRSRWTTVYVFLVFTIFSIGYNTPDSYVLLIPAFMILGLWFGWGAATMIEAAGGSRWRTWLVPVTAGAFSLLILANAGSNYPRVDASQDRRAVDFGREVLSELPEEAIVVTREDEDTFTLWYYHFALGQRPDIVVVNSGSLVYPWYRDRMGEVYPQVVLKDHQGCHECMLEDLSTLNAAPICETLWNAPHPLACLP